MRQGVIMKKDDVRTSRREHWALVSTIAPDRHTPWAFLYD